MFESYLGLTGVPDNLLPATEFGNGCYGNMFKYCNNHTKEPTIPNHSLSGTVAPLIDMFSGCTNLNEIRVEFEQGPASNDFENWVDGLSAAGTFCKPSALPEEFEPSRIPPGWTVVNI